MQTIAFDSKEYHASGLKPFFAPIGIGIQTQDSISFKQTYDEALQQIFDGLGIVRRRRALSNETLAHLYGDSADMISEKLLDRVSEKITNVWFFYTQVDSTKTPYIYSEGRDRKLPPLEYIRNHQQSYPYWCAWRLSLDHHIGDSAILLDAFQGEETEAWNELKAYNPSVLFKGDEVNPLISTADILLARVDRVLRMGKLREPLITKAFDELGFEATTFFIGQPHYGKITSVSNRQIDIRRYVPRPLIFVLHDGAPKGIIPKDWEQTRFLAPLLDTPLNHAFEDGVGFKGFDYNQDGALLDPQKDVIYYYGSEGNKIQDKISTLYRVPPKNFRKIT